MQGAENIQCFCTAKKNTPQQIEGQMNGAQHRALKIHPQVPLEVLGREFAGIDRTPLGLKIGDNPNKPGRWKDRIELEQRIFLANSIHVKSFIHNALEVAKDVEKGKKCPEHQIKNTNHLHASLPLAE